MKWTRRIGALMTLALVVCVGTTVHAQDEMVFDEDDDDMVFDFDEIDEADLEHLDELLEEGQELYERRSYEEASLRFFDVLQDDVPGAEGHHAEAEYELARSLFRLHLYQGALRYFGAIAREGDFHPYFQPALRGLLLLTEVIPGDMTLAEHLGRYAEFFPEIVPETYRDRYAYLVGRQKYDNMDYREAVRLLSFIDDDSVFYGRARYIMAITHVADNEAEPAAQAFNDVLSYLRGLDKTPDDFSAEEALLYDLAHMGLARVYYSTGHFDTSLNYYSLIDRDSPRWPAALFESSWGYFNVERFNHALGNLHSLNSPFFDDAYFPEGPILAAVIYYYNCNFDLVRETLDDFDFVYAAVHEELDAILEQNPDSWAMYEWGVEWRNGGLENGQPELESALRANLEDRQLVQRFNLVESIDREMELMGQLADSWQASELGEELMGYSSLAHSDALADAGELVQRRVERTREELRGLLTQQEEILFEVARAERGEAELDAQAGMQIDEHVRDAPELDVSSEEMYWAFDGEYWQDELGYYVFDIRSECRR